MKLLLSILIFIALILFRSDYPYKDGTYKGLSRAEYTYEPYYGQVKIVVEGGMITRVAFNIRDSLKHEYFDDSYERYFAGNDEYVRQCRNDRQGVKSYPDSLVKYQDPEKVDAFSGATWSYNIFIASVHEALASAVAKDH